MSLSISAEEPPTNTTDKTTDVKGAELGKAGAGLNWGGNAAAFKAELKISAIKAFLKVFLVFIQSQINRKGLKFFC